MGGVLLSNIPKPYLRSVPVKIIALLLDLTRILIPTLERTNIVTREDFNNNFSEERSRIDEDPDDYLPSFDWSDIIVTDASSLLFQYLPTGKPVVYLEKPDGWGLETAMQSLIERFCYIVKNRKGLRQTLRQLQDGHDPLLRERFKIANSISKNMLERRAGHAIASYLEIILGETQT